MPQQKILFDSTVEDIEHEFNIFIRVGLITYLACKKNLLLGKKPTVHTGLTYFDVQKHKVELFFQRAKQFEDCDIHDKKKLLLRLKSVRTKRRILIELHRAFEILKILSIWKEIKLLKLEKEKEDYITEKNFLLDRFFPSGYENPHLEVLKAVENLGKLEENHKNLLIFLRRRNTEEENC